MGDQIHKLILEEFYVFRYLHLNHRNILLKKKGKNKFIIIDNDNML